MQAFKTLNFIALLALIVRDVTVVFAIVAEAIARYTIRAAELTVLILGDLIDPVEEHNVACLRVKHSKFVYVRPVIHGIGARGNHW